MTLALAAGPCQSKQDRALAYGGVPPVYIVTQMPCSLEAGHAGDHQWIRGSWVLARWDNSPDPSKGPRE